MSIEGKILQEFAQDIVKDVGAAIPADQLQRQERAFVALATGVPRGQLYRRLLSVAGAAAILVLGLGVWYLADTPKPISFQIGATTSETHENVWVRAPLDRSLPIRFEGGTTIDLDAQTALRIVKSSAENVDINVSRGNVRADIAGNGMTRWTMNAGPYRLSVLGTVFSVNWQPESLVLDVAVEEGLVLVHGKGINNHGIKLSAGSSLKADAKRGLVALNSENTNDIIAESAAETDSVELGDDPTEPPAIAIPKSRSPRPEPADPRIKLDPQWKQAYLREDYRQAIDIAQKSGLQNLVQRTSKQDLWLLADAARNAGQPRLARRLLIAFRARFKTSKKARLAAFLLGRIDLEDQRNPAAASKWFKIYLNGGPRGPLVEEALGKLMVAYNESQKTSKAEKTARTYLDRYPRGSFAKLARHILSNPL